jgi:hypothetical protein
MATAKKVPTDYEVQLTLSRVEAEFLRTVLGHVGGCPLKSARRYSDSILKALRDVVERNEAFLAAVQSGVSFKDE